MRSLLLRFLVLLGLTTGSLTASAQQAGPPTTPARPATNRLALASPAEAAPAAPAKAARLACSSRLDGQVLDADGKPLIGATVTVKGTPHTFITNGEGHYLIDAPVYQGQVLEIEAAGYTTRELTLTDCTVPVAGLELAAGTRIKKKGKRAGQIVRFGTADMQ